MGISQLVYQSTTNSLQFLTATDTNRKKFLIDLLNLDNYIKYFDTFKVAHKEVQDQLNEIKGEINNITNIYIYSRGIYVLISEAEI